MMQHSVRPRLEQLEERLAPSAVHEPLDLEYVYEELDHIGIHREQAAALISTCLKNDHHPSAEDVIKCVIDHKENDHHEDEHHHKEEEHHHEHSPEEEMGHALHELAEILHRAHQHVHDHVHGHTHDHPHDHFHSHDHPHFPHPHSHEHEHAHDLEHELLHFLEHAEELAHHAEEIHHLYHQHGNGNGNGNGNEHDPYRRAYQHALQQLRDHLRRNQELWQHNELLDARSRMETLLQRIEYELHHLQEHQAHAPHKQELDAVFAEMGNEPLKENPAPALMATVMLGSHIVQRKNRERQPS